MSDDMESVTEEERREAVKTQVRRVFGGEADQMIDYRDTPWSREQFTELIKLEQVKDKERPVIAKPPTPKPRVVKPFFKPEKQIRGQWRRSTAPGAGHQRTGRLKRVDTTETAGGARTRRPLADINNIYDN